ncbi:ankyrin repeat-containing domain protein [Tirmania nivea]|nr:ankyrin repeat-containing domain protein [Tirmania nivea]
MQNVTFNTACHSSLETALSLAAFKGNVNIVSLLLGRGAGINIAASMGLRWALAASSPRNEKIVKLLLDRKANINVMGGKYGTALGAAAYFEEEAIVSLLLEKGAEVIHVGGFYRFETAQDEYPTPLGAGQAGGAQAGTLCLRVWNVP